MAYEFNPFYFEREATREDFDEVNKFVEKLQRALDEMSSVNEVYSLICFFEDNEPSYPIYLKSMCFAALRAAYTLTHPLFRTSDCDVVIESFPDWEGYKLNVPNYIFVRKLEKFPTATWETFKEKNDNFSKLFNLYLEGSRNTHGATGRVYYEIFSTVLRISGVRILIHETTHGLEFKVVNGKSLLYKALSKDGSSIEILD